MSAPVEWIKERVRSQQNWFHRIDLGNGIATPGWSDPKLNKLPHYGLPADMKGMRVLDVGTAEGFFAFEAERRGADQVVAVDPYSVDRFMICRDALGSAVKFLGRSVYELDPMQVGTFDLVMFFGVLYHLRHPLLGLDKLRAVCSGAILLQTFASPLGDESAKASFYKKGIMSGPNKKRWDPSVFFVPNTQCVLDLMENAGFVNVEALLPDTSRVGVVARGLVENPTEGRPTKLLTPWC